MSELVQGLLCADHSFKLARTAWQIRGPRFSGEGFLRPTDLLYALRYFCTAYLHCVHASRHCIARLRSNSRSVAARSGTSLQTLAELLHWRASAGAGCGNGDGLLIEHSIGNDHAVGNDE